jgi:anti-anti-sigma factor
MPQDESHDNQEEPTGSPFSMSLRTDDPRVEVLTVRGEVDLASAPLLSESLSAAIGRRPEILVVDMSQVEVLTSAGMAVLLGGHNRAQGLTRLRVVASTEATTRPLQLLGLTKVMAVFPTIDQALNAHET